MLDTRKLNTPRVGRAGLFTGGATLVIGAVYTFFKVLSRPQILVDLYHAIEHVRDAAKHVPGAVVSDADLTTLAQIVGPAIAIVGALCVAFLLTYFGMPAAIANQLSGTSSSDTPAQPGGAASSQKG